MDRLEGREACTRCVTAFCSALPTVSGAILRFYWNAILVIQRVLVHCINLTYEGNPTDKRSLREATRIRSPSHQ